LYESAARGCKRNKRALPGQKHFDVTASMKNKKSGAILPWNALELAVTGHGTFAKESSHVSSQ
jgi:hypothetical protein